MAGCALGTPTSSVATCQQEGLTIFEMRQVSCSCAISGTFLNFWKLPFPRLAGARGTTYVEGPHPWVPPPLVPTAAGDKSRAAGDEDVASAQLRRHKFLNGAFEKTKLF